MRGETIRAVLFCILWLAWIVWFFVVWQFKAGLYDTAPNIPDVPAGLVFELHSRGNVFRYVSQRDYLISQSIWFLSPIYIAVQAALYYWPSKTKPAAHTKHIKGAPHATP